MEKILVINTSPLFFINWLMDFINIQTNREFIVKDIPFKLGSALPNEYHEGLLGYYSGVIIDGLYKVPALWDPEEQQFVINPSVDQSLLSEIQGIISTQKFFLGGKNIFDKDNCWAYIVDAIKFNLVELGSEKTEIRARCLIDGLQDYFSELIEEIEKRYQVEKFGSTTKEKLIETLPINLPRKPAGRTPDEWNEKAYKIYKVDDQEAAFNYWKENSGYVGKKPRNAFKKAMKRAMEREKRAGMPPE